jgi:hypothetical protein
MMRCHQRCGDDGHVLEKVGQPGLAGMTGSVPAGELRFHLQLDRVSGLGNLPALGVSQEPAIGLRQSRGTGPHLSIGMPVRAASCEMPASRRLPHAGEIRQSSM